ncbi:MAG: outer membrane beta-barrel protein, partial [Methylocystis sp.]|nr:outer membrane beta-barrel protein [Methylocystis sp.]
MRATIIRNSALFVYVGVAPCVAHAAESAPLNWAGMYVGANVGAGFPLHRGERLQAPGNPAFDLYPDGASRPGVTVGAQAGYNWQYGPWVWGFETDLNLLDGRRGPTGVFPAANAPFFAITSHSSANFFASLRGRAGVAFDRMLLYLTGGVAVGGARGPATLSVGGAQFEAGWSQSSRMKYALGAGFEYAFAKDWSLRGEYLFLNQALNTQLFDNGAGYFFSRLRNENHILRFGLNYHFSPENEIFGAIDYGKRAENDGAGDKGEAPAKEEQYSIHAQTTSVLQGYPRFYALYDGPNSFPSGGKANFGSTNNIFMGLRLWEGGAAYLNPEIDFGYGLANSVGAAAYVNSAVAKVGRAAPYMRFQRYFLRQIIGLDGGGQGPDPDEGSLSEVLESTQNQISGHVDKDRIVVTLGKFAVGDVFDDNVYAHDPNDGAIPLKPCLLYTS